MSIISNDLQKLAIDFDVLYNSTKLPKPGVINTAKKLLHAIRIHTDEERALKHNILCKIEELQQRSKSPSPKQNKPPQLSVGKNGAKWEKPLGVKIPACDKVKHYWRKKKHSSIA